MFSAAKLEKECAIHKLFFLFPRRYFPILRREKRTLTYYRNVIRIFAFLYVFKKKTRFEQTFSYIITIINFFVVNL